MSNELKNRDGIPVMVGQVWKDSKKEKENKQMKIEIDVDIPDGYEFVRYGYAKEGEYYLDNNNNIVCASMDHTLNKNIIFSKKKPERWRPNAGERYWKVNGCLKHVLDRNLCRDSNYKEINVGNCFCKEEQAKELARRWKKVAEEYQQELLEDENG